MPNAGGVKITKKPRTMDFWGPMYAYMRHRTYREYVAPYWFTKMHYSWDSHSTKCGGSGGLTFGYSDGSSDREDSTITFDSCKGISINDIPNGVIINQANLMIKFSRVENTTSELSYFDATPTAFTYLEAADRIRIDRLISTADRTSLANMTAITLTDDMVRVESDGNKNGGIIISNVDIKEVVSCNGYYFMTWRNMFTTGELKFHDIQLGIRMVFK